MSHKDPKVVFLDIGGVLLTNGWDHNARKKAAGHFDLEYPVLDAYHAFIFNIYEIGQITLDQYLDTVVFQKPRKFTHREFADFIKAQSEELPGGFIAWLSNWKQKTNHRVIAINNEGKELNDFRIKKFHLKNCFDAFISSCEVGMRKPDPGIFRLAMGIAQTTPADSIYFDDRPMLAAAAARLGMNALVHDTPEKTMAILENIES